MKNNENLNTAIYFPVLTNNYTSELSLDIRMNYGWSGYGIYFALLQKLAAVAERKLSINSLIGIAFDLHISLDELKPLVEKYFDVEGDYFYSIELNKSLGYYDAKFNQASEAGKKSASLLTPEERKERAKKAINTRWNKEGENTNDTNGILTVSIKNTNALVSDTNDILTTLESDTNNKIKENKIEQKEKKEEKTKVENFSDFENFLPDAITSPSTSSSTNFSNQYNRLEMLNSIEFLIDRNFHKEHLLTFYQEYLKECNNNPIDFIEYTKLVLLTKQLQLAAYFKNYHIEENYSNFIKEINKAENYLTYINPEEVNYIKSLPNFNQVIQLLEKIKK